MKKIKKWEKLILDNWFRKIISRDYEVSRGIIYNYLIAKSSNTDYATMNMALTKDKEIIYIKEFREWIEDYVFGFSVWVYEKELTFEENAKKELKEETWYIWKKIIYLWESITANYEDMKIKYFFTNDCEFIWQNLETWEDIEVFKCSVKEFEEKIKLGIINCPLALSCYTLAKLNGYV